MRVRAALPAQRCRFEAPDLTMPGVRPTTLRTTVLVIIWTSECWTSECCDERAVGRAQLSDLADCRQYPLVLAGNRLAEIHLQTGRQDAPGVGFDLEMRGEWILRRGCEDPSHVVLRRGERRVLAREERHVKVNAPLGPRRARVVERHVEVGVAAESVGLLLDDLVQVCRISKWTQLGGEGIPPGAGRSGKRTSTAELSCTRPTWMPAALQPLERHRGILVLDGEVTAVEADPDVVLQMAARIVGSDPKLRGEDQRADREQPPLEKRDRLVSRSRERSPVPARCRGG